jgi:hypothetical protein
MIEKVRTLEEEIARVKAWDTEKKRYVLSKIGDTGAVAYALKESMSNSEPPHHICTNCYEDGRKSILHPHKMTSSRIALSCQKCGLEIHTRFHSFTPEYANG